MKVRWRWTWLMHLWTGVAFAIGTFAAFQLLQGELHCAVRSLLLAATPAGMH